MAEIITRIGKMVKGHKSCRRIYLALIIIWMGGKNSVRQDGNSQGGLLISSNSPGVQTIAIPFPSQVSITKAWLVALLEPHCR